MWRTTRAMRSVVLPASPGFESSRAVALFKPFSRMHGAGYEGSGIGLSIVRRAVERLGGQVWAESSPGQGARFFFTLPLTCS